MGHTYPQRKTRAVLECDEETGLHYNRFRYFDPDLGMFTTRDPIGLMGGSNVFQYAPNPTGWIDPFGLMSIRKEMYPSRVRKPTRQTLEKNSNGVCANSGCNNTFDVTDTKNASVQHNPPLYQTHNEFGYNTDQKTRNNLYNTTAESLVCLDCQKREGGSMGVNERYTPDTGDEFKPRKPRKPTNGDAC